MQQSARVPKARENETLLQKCITSCDFEMSLFEFRFSFQQNLFVYA